MQRHKQEQAQGQGLARKRRLRVTATPCRAQGHQRNSCRIHVTGTFDKCSWEASTNPPPPPPHLALVGLGNVVQHAPVRLLAQRAQLADQRAVALHAAVQLLQRILACSSTVTNTVSGGTSMLQNVLQSRPARLRTGPRRVQVGLPQLLPALQHLCRFVDLLCGILRQWEAGVLVSKAGRRGKRQPRRRRAASASGGGAPAGLQLMLMLRPHLPSMVDDFRSGCKAQEAY